jgi:hypothetical protein
MGYSIVLDKRGETLAPPHWPHAGTSAPSAAVTNPSKSVDLAESCIGKERKRPRERRRSVKGMFLSDDLRDKYGGTDIYTFCLSPSLVLREHIPSLTLRATLVTDKARKYHGHTRIFEDVGNGD